MNRLLQSIPRWTVLQLDLAMCAFSLLLAYTLRLNFDFSSTLWASALIALPLLTVIKSFFFYTTKSYAGIIRFTSIEDAKRIFKALTMSLGVVLVMEIIYWLLTKVNI